MSAWILSLFVASCVFAAHGLPSGRVVGGEGAPAGKYPFQISLRYHGSHSCGGSIINKRYILTAAHCVYDVTPEDLTVVVGSHLLNKGGVAYKVSQIISHDFDSFYVKNDVAVVRVSDDIKFSEHVQPVVLSDYEDQRRAYTGVTIGWGRLSHGGNIPNQLQHLHVKVIEQAVCVDAWRWNVRITPDQICASTGYGTGVCHGDSGSALLIDGKQVGIASFVSGRGCAKGVPDVYTRVSAFKSWIEDRTRL